MKKLIILLSCFCVLLSGCSKLSSPKVSLEEEDVTEYFGKTEIPDTVTFRYENTNGKQELSNLNNAPHSLKMMYVYNGLGDITSLQGNLDGIWYYGWGDENHLLIAFGEEKDEVYDLMKGYEGTFMIKDKQP